MNHIEITEEGVVYCDGFTCHPLDNYIKGTYCKDCPLLILVNQLEDIRHD